MIDAPKSMLAKITTTESMEASKQINPTHTELTFREVVALHQRDLYKWAFRLTGNHHDAEDLSQEVFIKVHASLSSFRGEAGLKTWIYRIAVNTYLNKRRKKALSFMKLQDNMESAMPAQSAFEQHGQGTDASAQSQSIKTFVDQALKHLSRKEHMAFVLRHYNELSVKEVASAMQVAEGTVKSLLFRAVQKLRKQLAFIADS